MKVELSLVTADTLGGFIICSSRFFSRVECTEPESNTLMWVPNLGCPFAPWPLPDPSKLVLSWFSFFLTWFRSLFFWLFNFINQIV
ncbi:hypothetical protein HanRHA438_Chr17g0792931 [Helianthus annuus]|nr:hypothetical protein HanRHA438_Chr17g0792931 [Helianthus annuus]